MFQSFWNWPSVLSGGEKSVQKKYFLEIFIFNSLPGKQLKHFWWLSLYQYCVHPIKFCVECICPAPQSTGHHWWMFIPVHIYSSFQLYLVWGRNGCFLDIQIRVELMSVLYHMTFQGSVFPARSRSAFASPRTSLYPVRLSPSGRVSSIILPPAQMSPCRVS